MVALKQSEQNEGVLALTNQFVYHRMWRHHGTTTPHEVPALLLVAPSRLGRGDNHIIRKLRFAIHVPSPHDINKRVKGVAMSGLLKREAEDRVVALAFNDSAFSS